MAQSKTCIQVLWVYMHFSDVYHIDSSGQCKGMNQALKLAGCSDLVAYSSDNHPQLSSKCGVDAVLRPDIAIYPTHSRATAAYALPAALSPLASECSEDFEETASQPESVEGSIDNSSEGLEDADVPTAAEVLKARIAWGCSARISQQSAKYWGSL